MENREVEIKEKSNYCLGCKIKPCSVNGCPLNNNIPEFIRLIKEGHYKSAYEVLCDTTVLQPICGRICPHKKQCQGSCVRGIKGEPVSIGDMEAFVGDIAIKEGYKIPKSDKKIDKKVAIIGGGPAGLTCAAFLAKEGVQVTIYEKYDYLGGILVHGIPEFRLSEKLVKDTINKILELGIYVKYNQELGRNITLEELEKQYDAIFLSFGANISSKMNIEGENLQGVYGGNGLLEYKEHPNYTEKTVAVIGGGNVAIDCARTIKKLGAETVKIIYRRAEKQMPAEEKEVQEAKEEGIEFLFQNNILKILGNNKVEKVELIKTELVKKEGEDRKVPINIEDSNYIIDVDYIIMALGSHPESFVNNLGLKLNKKGYIEVDENKQTSNEKIFAGGDLAGEKGTVAWAARSGRDVAKSIMRYLQNKED